MGAMIGKGKRSPEVIDAIVRNAAVYFAAVGGAGALLSKCITSSEVIAYDDLGTEAVRRLTVKDFPVIVVVETYMDDGTEKYIYGAIWMDPSLLQSRSCGQIYRREYVRLSQMD